jgi:hypothetical protein
MAPPASLEITLEIAFQRCRFKSSPRSWSGSMDWQVEHTIFKDCLPIWRPEILLSRPWPMTGP